MWNEFLGFLSHCAWPRWISIEMGVIKKGDHPYVWTILGSMLIGLASLVFIGCEEWGDETLFWGAPWFAVAFFAYLIFGSIFRMVLEDL